MQSSSFVQPQCQLVLQRVFLCPAQLSLVCVYVCVCVFDPRSVFTRACSCADLAGPLARLLVERLGSCQNGLIDRLVGGHHQQFWLIVILTISKLIFIIYLPLLYCLLILRLGGGWEGGQVLLLVVGGAGREVGRGGGGKKGEM